MTDLEIGSSARNADEWDRLVGALGAFRRVDVEAHHFDRARHVERTLATNGLKGRKVPDLLIAAVAEATSLTVLHYDADFDYIAAVTGQPTEWIVERGSIDRSGSVTTRSGRARCVGALPSALEGLMTEFSRVVPTAGALYGPGARTLQDAFDSRRLADTLAGVTVHDTLDAHDIELIRAQSTVWISTVDADGWPDVSYKGGDVGFVDVVSAGELRIPSYDGNGMWRTLGNVIDDGRVALLFLDAQRPWRMRVHGHATVSIEPAALEPYAGAQAVLVVSVARVFPNCGRYIHSADGISKFVPRAGSSPPIPDWKRIDALRPMLPARDQEALEHDDGTKDGADGS